VADIIDDQIDRESISTAGYSFLQPRVPNTSEENRALNRRVEITIDFMQ
jgi:outer membrane protein OmpA-like peptidoglycan-associated protein